MGALSDVVNMGHWGRVRMWLLTIAVAIVGTSLLAYTGQVDLAKSVPQRPVISWLSLLAGGLVFGVGMTLAGGCANKNLVRLGGGSVRSLVVLDLPGDRVLHDAQGPVRAMARDAARPGAHRPGGARLDRREPGHRVRQGDRHAPQDRAAGDGRRARGWPCWCSSSRTSGFAATPRRSPAPS